MFSKAKKGAGLLFGLALVLLGGVLSSNSLYAQSRITVSGTVTDGTGYPVIAAGVVLQGTTNGTTTDVDGNYTITNVSADAVLSFSAIGYKTQEIQVSGRTVINVVLEEDFLSLEDAVVIGYGTQRKSDVTSAVASVKSDDFLQGNFSDAAQLVKGKVAGLTITKGSGNPTESSTVRLRGITSIYGSLTPLVLIDGVAGSMNDVAPENIESIDVLKDASAAAIYGTRGANGVIIITTKSGKLNEHFEATYNAYGSVSNWYKKADFMGADWIRAGAQYSTFKDEGFDTDWLGAISRTGWTQNHSLTLQGGSESTAYFAAVSYRQDEGVMINSNNNDLRMQFDVTQYAFKNIVKFNLNILKDINSYKLNNASYAYRQAVIHNPTSPIYNLDENGVQDPSLGYYEEFSRFQYYNPVEIMNEYQGDVRSESTKLAGNITIEPVKGWQTNIMLTTNRSNSVSQSYTSLDYYTNATTKGTSDEVKGSASKGQNTFEENLIEITTKYEKNVNNHRISALAGYSWQYDLYDSFSASNSNFPTESYLYNNLGAGEFAKLTGETEIDGVKYYTGLKRYAGVGSSKSSSTLIGFFARVSYGYDNRYNVLLSLRHEGSSKFGTNNKWANFPSVSLGWNVHNEDFMSDVTWLDNLKVRAGYGKTGIIPGSNYLSLTMMNYDTSYGRFLNEKGEWVPSLVYTQNPNPNIKWETTSEYSFGVDFGFLGGRLGGSLDLYYKQTDDLLYDFTVPVPPNRYSSMTANAGKLSNKGIELAINATPILKKDFEWNTVFTVSHNQSKLISLSNDLYETESYYNTGGVGDPISVSTHRVEEGQPFGQFFMLKSVGVTAKGKWVVENPNAVSYDEAAGTWVDADGNACKKYMEYSTSLNSDEYRQYMGSGIPKAYLSWGNNFRYRNFDLSIQMSSQLGFNIFNSQRAFYQNRSIAYNRLVDSAIEQPVVDLTTGQPTGETALLSTSQQQCVVSAYLERGDYLKLDNVTLGYTLNFKNEWLKSVRAYVTGQNLFCLTGYSGLDPELSNSYPFASGLDDRDKYPTIRTFTLGVSVKF